MTLAGPYVHSIDPILFTVFGVHLWWYGVSYALGFLNAFLSIRRSSGALGLTPRSAYDLGLLLSLGVLLGGRSVEVLLYEWPFYREHPELIPAFWLGGMATHGLLFGGLLGIGLFSLLRRKPFLQLTDALAIPAAVILGLGRLGNFIDGQIVGSVTAVPWAVKFPDAEGYRHPVVLYDGLKNLMIVPILLLVARWQVPRGFRTGLFLFLYASLRILIDVFREYPTTLLGLATGQVLNITLSMVGLALVVIPWFASQREAAETQQAESGAVGPETGSLAWRRVAFAAILLFSLVLPSDWTQDVPDRYGKRHPGLTHSVLYPDIDTRSPQGAP